MILAGNMVFLLIFSSGGLWSVLIILLSFLTIRELVQMSACLKRYFRNLENILELVMISLLGYLLLDQDSAADCECSVKRQVAALIIVLSWVEMIVLLAKHPRLSNYSL